MTPAAIPPNAIVAWYDIGVDHPIAPDEPLPPTPDIPRGSLAVLTGRGPIWRYVQAFHLLHGSPAGAIGVYDPRLGVVVVGSHSPAWKDGSLFDLRPPASGS